MIPLSVWLQQKHDIPLSAIPCLQYLKALDVEKAQIEDDRETSSGGIQENGMAGEGEQVSKVGVRSRN